MPKIKRESRSFIVINEEKLIAEVQKRPILYDKALKGYRKPVTRENAWQEVSDLLQSPVEECKKRWRSLRDAFMKQYKLFQRGDPSIKKRWLFYEQMEFLGPYVDADVIVKYEDAEFIVDRESEGFQPKETSASYSSQQIICMDETDPSDYHSEHIFEYNLDEDEEDNEAPPITTKPEGNRSQATHAEPQNSSSHSKPSTLSQHHTNDPDEQFLLSCLPIFQRLSHKKNALARLKIQKLLFEIEFNDESS